MSKRKLTILIFGILLLTSGLAVSAASPRPPNEKHCVNQIFPVEIGSQEPSVTHWIGCFSTFAEAINAATGGKVQLDPSIKASDVTDQILNPHLYTNKSGQEASEAFPESDTVIGIDYENSSYGGSSLVHSYPYGGCTDSVYFQLSSMPSGWDNRVSSAKVFGGCEYFYHYENNNYGGSRLDCSPCTSMGAMNDQTSSEKWSKNALP